MTTIVQFSAVPFALAHFWTWNKLTEAAPSVEVGPKADFPAFWSRLSAGRFRACHCFANVRHRSILVEHEAFQKFRAGRRSDNVPIAEVKASAEGVRVGEG